MSTANELLNIVRAQLGNGGKKYWDYMFKGSLPYVSGSATPFCACGVSWSLAQAHVEAPYFPSTFAFDTRDKKTIGSRWVDKNDLQAGDIIGFDWLKLINGKYQRDGKGDHVGFCEIAPYGGTVQTIEFNTNGGIVARRSRSLDDVIGGIRPYYDKAQLEVDGYIGKKTITEWQEQVGAVHKNKWVGGQREESARYHSSLTAVTYDYGGSRLVATVQKKLGVTPTGYWDYDFSGALQAYLRAKGYIIDADHFFGNKSARALQRSLNDGLWSK